MSEENLRGADELGEKLYERLRRSLKLSGLSVTDLAAYLEVHRVTVGAWLNDRAQPGPANVRLWAMQTGVPYEWLKTGNYPEVPKAEKPQVKKTRQRVR